MGEISVSDKGRVLLADRTTGPDRQWISHEDQELFLSKGKNHHRQHINQLDVLSVGRLASGHDCQQYVRKVLDRMVNRHLDRPSSLEANAGQMPVWGLNEPSYEVRKYVPGMPSSEGDLPNLKQVGMKPELYTPNEETKRYPVERHHYAGKLSDGTGVKTDVVLFPFDDDGKPNGIFQEVNVHYEKPQTITIPSTPPGGKSITLKDVTAVHVYKLSDNSEVIFFEPPKRRPDGTIEYNEVSCNDGKWESRVNTLDHKPNNSHRSEFRPIEER